jgi:aminoglycoside 2'-N-acetyltransferase I
VASSELAEGELQGLRRLVDGAFGADFGDHDWDHTLGGTHVIVEADAVALSHASIVPRTLLVGDRSLSTGYVEAVATRPAHQRHGYATLVMSEAARVIAENYEMGALSTGALGFYTRLGWELWAGPTFVATASGLTRTADDDGGVLVLRTPATADLDLRAPLACDWREGDVW